MEWSEQVWPTCRWRPTTWASATTGWRSSPDRSPGQKLSRRLSCPPKSFRRRESGPRCSSRAGPGCQDTSWAAAGQTWPSARAVHLKRSRGVRTHLDMLFNISYSDQICQWPCSFYIAQVNWPCTITNTITTSKSCDLNVSLHQHQSFGHLALNQSKGIRL